MPGFKYKIGEIVTLCYPSPPFIIGTKVKIVNFIIDSDYPSSAPMYIVKRIDGFKIDDRGYYYSFSEHWLSPLSLELTEVINSRRIVARKDGTLKVDCIELNKEEIDKIIEFRKKAMEL